MHGLESDAIVKLFTPLVIKFKSCLQKPFLFLCGRQPVSGDQIFVNIQEGFVLIYRLFLRSKDVFAEDFFLHVLIVLHTTDSFHFVVVIS